MKQKSYPFHIIFSAKIVAPLIKLFNALSDLGYLAVRLWVANIFFTSALSKITDWGSTIVLFKYDYSVPFMSPVFAAYLGTGLEFLLPALLVLGLGGRLSIFVFLIYNIFCVISFHFLWTPPGQAGLYDHVNWGLLLMLLMFHGSGRISIDYLLRKRYGHLLELGNKKRFLWFSH
jgi:putative oxidoreductase